MCAFGLINSDCGSMHFPTTWDNPCNKVVTCFKTQHSHINHCQQHMEVVVLLCHPGQSGNPGSKSVTCFSFLCLRTHIEKKVRLTGLNCV